MMWMTLFGALLGGIFSWVITYRYYRITESKAARENPIRLLEQVSADVVVIKERLGPHSSNDPTLRDAIDRSQRHIEHVKYVFRAALQNWFSEFTALKYTVAHGAISETMSQIAKMDTMMKSMAPALRDASLDTAATASITSKESEGPLT